MRPISTTWVWSWLSNFGKTFSIAKEGEVEPPKESSEISTPSSGNVRDTPLQHENSTLTDLVYPFPLETRGERPHSGTGLKSRHLNAWLPLPPKEDECPWPREEPLPRKVQLGPLPKGRNEGRLDPLNPRALAKNVLNYSGWEKTNISCLPQCLKSSWRIRLQLKGGANTLRAMYEPSAVLCLPPWRTAESSNRDDDQALS